MFLLILPCLGQVWPEAERCLALWCSFILRWEQIYLARLAKTLCEAWAIVIAGNGIRKHGNSQGYELKISCRPLPLTNNKAKLKPGMTWKVFSSRPWSISLVMTLRLGYLLQSWCMPFGAAIRLRKRIFPSSTPLLSKTCSNRGLVEGCIHPVECKECLAA